ncbi:MAG: ribosome maturation factor RimM [Candidatus Gastranaerophilales bacterium]
MTKLVSVGKILNFHGLQGEAKVGFSKNQQDFFCGLKKVTININGEDKILKIKSIRHNKNFAIVKFEGINSIDELLDYKDLLLYVDEKVIRDALEEDEFLIDELVGLEVFDENDEKIGFVVGVSNNGATDLLSIKTKSKKIALIPFVKAIVTFVSIKEKRIVINNLEGLIDEI